MILLALLLVGCVPSSYPEFERWTDLEDLVTGRRSPEGMGFALPWPSPLEEPPPRVRHDPRREVVHGCLLFPLTGESETVGHSALRAAALALEDRGLELGPRVLEWHVADTTGQSRAGVEAADACIRRGAMVLVGPLMDGATNSVVRAMFEREAAILLPEPGAADLNHWNERFVAIAPPVVEMGHILGRDAAESDPAAAAAFVVDGPYGMAVAAAWDAAFVGTQWRSVGRRDLPQGDPEAWRVAFRESVAAGTRAFLVAGPAKVARPIIEEMNKPGFEDVRLWLVDWASQVALLDEVEQRNAVGRLRFLTRNTPDREFRRRFTRRWGEPPTELAASVYDAVMAGYQAVETSEYLVQTDLGLAARHPLHHSAWGDGTRGGDAPLDHTVAAGYTVTRAARSPPDGVWTFEPVTVRVSQPEAERLGPLAPSRAPHD